MLRFALTLLALCAAATASPIVTSSFRASLDNGSLAGVIFPVSFSYDAGQIQPAGDSYITLSSLDFVLLGVPFNRSEISQGGQVMFHNGVLLNVTASYQGILLPLAPVRNVTFGFGGPGIIGYIDLNNQFGLGSFTFTSVPEPAILPATLAILLTGLLVQTFKPTARIKSSALLRSTTPERIR